MSKSEKAKTKRCICGATMKFSTTNAQFRYAGTDIEIKNVKTYLCPCCGNEIIAPQESKKLEHVIKVFGRGIKTIPMKEVEIVESDSVTIYTDGACSGNPGKGGWAAILLYNGQKLRISGHEPETTNNRMEMTAVIQALKKLNRPCTVDLYSDSKYVLDPLDKGWAQGWKAKGWKKADKKPALNADLWEILLDLTEKHTMRYHWVKGHAYNVLNDECDRMAVAESTRVL